MRGSKDDLIGPCRSICRTWTIGGQGSKQGDQLGANCNNLTVISTPDTVLTEKVVLLTLITAHIKLLIWSL